MVTVFTKEKALELRKNYQAIETIWKFIQSYNEPLRKNKDFKEALKIAQDNGINTALYNDCLENWDKVSEDVGRIIYDIEKQVDAETATKLRLLASYIIWPIKFSRAAQAVMYSQHWFFFTKPPKDKDLLPIELEPISPEEFKQRNFVYGGWLEENFFTTSNELVRAIVYGEDRYYEYNFQDLPVKSLLKKIKATSTKWGEAAREAAKKEKFRFDKDFTGDYPYTVYERERLDLTWNAAPEELRNEHIAAVRQLVKEVWKYHQKKLNPPQISTKTNLPDQLVFPIDKVTQTAFSGKANGQTTPIRSERLGSKKEITTLLSINFDDLGKDVIVNGKKELAPSDREVHNAIVTLCEFGNEYITAQAIYRTLVGDKKARISEKHRNEIYESITKCMFTQVDLDDSEDAKAYGYNALKYRGPLLAAEFVVGVVLNGQTVDGIRIFRRPVLFEYASKKNQIGRIDTKLLATPLNKTSEVLVLQGYLHRRISAMKNSKLPKKILYSSIFEQIGDLEEREQKDKKTKMRTAVRKILDYWKEQNFIVDYKEEKRGVLYHGINIFLPPKEA